jgi:IS30 family transposase
MTDNNSKKNKHLTFEDRLEIQGGLNHGMTFKAIAKRIGKDQTTVSKEVKRHLNVKLGETSRLDVFGRPQVCPLHIKAPFVCNPCGKKHTHCKHQKQYYHAKVAQKEYETLLVEAREGIPLNKESFYEIDRIISDGVKNGQRLYHIMQSNNLGISKSTVYRHLHRNYLSVAKLDFPRVVKFKARKKRQEEYIPRAAKVGRTYDDFLAYKQENDIDSWVEMDTVIGRVGGKTILTLDFTFCNFMPAILLDNKTSAEVEKKITNLKKLLYSKGIQFGEVFPLLLTDNGGEFANVWAIENNIKGEMETSLFFCDPMQSQQKPRVEKNHTLFRDIAPKGTSFDTYTQESVNLIFSHVNSIKRKCFYGKTPYELFSFAFGEKVAALLGISPIPADKVIQSPKLLKLI